MAKSKKKAATKKSAFKKEYLLKKAKKKKIAKKKTSTKKSIPKKKIGKKKKALKKLVPKKKGATKIVPFVSVTERFAIQGRSITVTGTFSNSANNNVMLDVYRSDPDPYDFSKSFSDSFTQVVDQLITGRGYHVDLAVTNTGNFDLVITGNFDNSPIKDNVTANFQHLNYVVIIN